MCYVQGEAWISLVSAMTVRAELWQIKFYDWEVPIVSKCASTSIYFY